MKLKDNINRLLSLLICLGILLCCLPFAASANESEENIWGDIKWSTDGDTLTISPVNGTAAMPDAESYNKTPWYSYRRDLIAVVINEGITHIGDYAFYGFENIRTVCDLAYANSKGYNFYILKYPSTLKSFGKAAFENCSALYDIVFPNRLYAPDGPSAGEIPDYAFSGCAKLAKITTQQNRSAKGNLPDGINRIGKAAFSGCGKLDLPFQTLRIPYDVDIIDERAFENCVTVKTLHLIGSIEQISSSAVNGCTSLSTIYIQLGTGQGGGHDRYYIPNNYKGFELYNKVQTQLLRIMPGASGTEYTVGDTVEKIGDYAFNSCSFEKITIGAGVKEIGESVFEDCNSLLNFEVSDANQYYKSVNGVLYTKDGKTLIAYPGGRSDKSFRIPDGVTRIAKSSLYSCDALNELYIPKSVTEIESFISFGIKYVYYNGSKAEFNNIDGSILILKSVNYDTKPNEKCDVNCDNKTDVLDIISIKKAISAGDSKTYQSDLNSDGKLNAQDMAALKIRLLTE